MDILRTRLVAWALDRAQGDGRYTIPYLVADPDDRYGYRHRPLADRAEVYRHSGIDLQDATRLPQDPARAMGCLVRFRERRYAGINPAPGDLWRLASIASGIRRSDRTDEAGGPARSGCLGMAAGHRLASNAVAASWPGRLRPTQASLDGRRKRAEGRFDRLRGEEVRGGAAKLRHRGFGQQNLLLHPAAMGGEQPLAL